MSGEIEILSSQWAGLSPHLLASIFVANYDGSRAADGFEVRCPLTDATMEIVANWQSPFEHMGPESRMPTIAGMLQSGTLEPYAVALLGKAADGDDSASARLSREITEFSRTGQGRTGMTKLNSTQVFNGAPPLKIHATAVFRAWRDPAVEVHAPIEALVRWSLARKLAQAGGIAGALAAFKEGQGFMKALLPSEAPPTVGFIYGGWGFSPMVIESVGMPLTVPRSGSGEMLSVSVSLTLATLTALDAQDWNNAIELKGLIQSSGHG